MIDQILKEVKPKAESAIANFTTNLSRLRTGRANPSVLDNVVVSYYGSNMMIKELASITVPDPGQIVIKPWERNVLREIETAIRNSDIGLAPINDGQQIRLVLPPMTEERRKEIAGQVKKMADETKVAIRNIRRDAWDKVQQAEKSNQATEDDRRWAEEELNKTVSELNKEVEKIALDKEKEVMSI